MLRDDDPVSAGHKQNVNKSELKHARQAYDGFDGEKLSASSTSSSGKF